uniref:Uncharacterized protein n=1 Tax=Paulinella chromatophora TaxID=39717 RepID=B1X5S6_PAUCH|nr:hypothetical protein PCC_0886 [Paulinella chromatophora]ACB43295.1 hypothetical protein PCC_0886 [Paulinella chromatophora]
MLTQHRQSSSNIKYLTDILFLGMGCLGLVLTGLTLHWQYSWNCNFQDLEKVRVLQHRLEKTTIMLEQYYLKRKYNPTQLITADIHNLIYVSDFRTIRQNSSKSLIKTILSLINSIGIHGQQEGY